MSNLPIKKIVIHCTATREGQIVNAQTIRGWHKAQGWNDIGYHYVVGIDGTIELGRPLNTQGSHVRGWNANTAAIVYVGGLDATGKAKDTRTKAQKVSIAKIVRELRVRWPVGVLGHRDLSPDTNKNGKVDRSEWLKECPCFDAPAWLAAGMPVD